MRIFGAVRPLLFFSCRLLNMGSALAFFPPLSFAAVIKGYFLLPSFFFSLPTSKTEIALSFFLFFSDSYGRRTPFFLNVLQISCKVFRGVSTLKKGAPLPFFSVSPWARNEMGLSLFLFVFLFSRPRLMERSFSFFFFSRDALLFSSSNFTPSPRGRFLAPFFGHMMEVLFTVSPAFFYWRFIQAFFFLGAVRFRIHRTVVFSPFFLFFCSYWKRDLAGPFFPPLFPSGIEEKTPPFFSASLFFFAIDKS